MDNGPRPRCRGRSGGPSTIHAIESGTDPANTLVRAAGLSLLGATMVAAVLRNLRSNRRRGAEPLSVGEAARRRLAASANR